MNRKFRWTPCRLLGLCAAVLALALGPLLTSGLDAQPPPPPPVKVVEQNLDANGFIKVHEQGTVTIGGGSIAVTNLPSTLNVHLAPVIGAFTMHYEVSPGGTLSTIFALRSM
jgi:hypothetical protein